MVRPAEPRSVDPSATNRNRAECKVILPTGVAGGDNVGCCEAGSAPYCHAPGRPVPPAPSLRRRLPVGRHHGEDAGTGDDHDVDVDHLDHRSRPSPSAAPGHPAATAAAPGAPAASAPTPAASSAAANHGRPPARGLPADR